MEVPPEDRCWVKFRFGGLSAAVRAVTGLIPADSHPPPPFDRNRPVTVLVPALF
jgi:hypothetical protein